MSFNDADDNDWQSGPAASSSIGSGSQLYPSFQDTTPTPTSTPNSKEDEYTSCHSQVSKNIQQLLTNFNLIKSMTQNIGKKKDTKKFRDQLNEKISTSLKLIREVQASIKRLDSLCSGPSKKELKQKVTKLNQDFENRLNTPFQQLVRQAKELMDEVPLITSAFDEGEDSASGYDERDHLLKQQREEEQFLALQDETDFQDSLVHERERDITSIQSQVIEVNEIFRDLARLVEDQGELVENIATNISTVVTNVKTASEEVDEAKESQQSSRKKLCFIALGIVVIVAVVVVVVVVLLKSKS